MATGRVDVVLASIAESEYHVEAVVGVVPTRTDDHLREEHTSNDSLTQSLATSRLVRWFGSLSDPAWYSFGQPTGT